MGISDKTLELVEKNLIDAEGYETKLYTDSVGKLTIGIGYNIQDLGLPEDIIHVLFKRTVDTAILEAAKIFPSFYKLPESVQAAIIELTFNLGATKLRTFKKFIAAVNAKQWTTAKAELLNSKWAQQVKSRRANRIADMITK